MALLVDLPCIREEAGQIAVALEGVGHRRDFPGVPDVVLIAEKDHVARAPRHGLLEVSVDAETGGVAMKADGEGGVGCEGPDDCQRPVTRGIVADDELIRQARLRCQALELLLEEGRSIPGAQSDGRPHSSHTVQRLQLFVGMRMKRTSDGGGIDSHEERGIRAGSDNFDPDDTLIDDAPSIDDFEELSGEADLGPDRRRDPLRK